MTFRVFFEQASFDSWMLVIIGIVVVLQIVSFVITSARICKLSSFFSHVQSLTLVQTRVCKTDLKSKIALDSIASSPKPFEGEHAIEDDCYLVNVIQYDNAHNNFLRDVIKQTNAYLCKNAGTSADLGVLEDICEQKVNAIKTEISSTLNVPLYLGLCGTFIGIIIGVMGISPNITHLFDTKSDLSSLTTLLSGVGVAMIASLVGLLLMVINSAIIYRNAIQKADNGQSEYFDFLRRELMPTLSNSMTSSLNSLRGVLGHFVDRFGQDLDKYADSATLLNENLEKQHLVLLEINKLSMVETSKAINKVFLKLKDSSEALQVFYNYQQGLNDTMRKVDDSVEKIDKIINHFQNFMAALEIVVKNQNVASELQQQFRESIEQNFPTGAEARDVWRKQYDALVEDSAVVTKSLNDQLVASTEYIKSFVDGNKAVFEAMGKQPYLTNKLVEYAQMQAKCYESLQTEIVALKQAFAQSQSQTIDMNKDIIFAVKEMTSIVKDLKSKNVL